MPRELFVDVRHNPSADYTMLPRQVGPAGPDGPPEPPDAVGARPLDLEVILRRNLDDTVRITALQPGLRSPRNGHHEAVLTVTATELLRRAGVLRRRWGDLVRYCTEDEYGAPHADYPFADSVDVSHLPDAEQLVAELADEGRYFLETMLDGADTRMVGLRTFLTGVLAEEGPLRVSFDSDLHLPWSMLAVDTGHDAVWTDFLGHRHQVEQTGLGYALIQAPPAPRARPVTSLNTDATLEQVGRAPDVRKLLEDRTELTVRTRGRGLLDAMGAEVLDEDVMYFWCHGRFADTGTAYSQLSVRLTDNVEIDADQVRRHRRRHRGAPDALFRAFVLLNACHTGQSAPAPDMEHVGGALVAEGAHGVLGPQIEIPQEFASEYAFAFLDLYLTGRFTAGEITQILVRHFAEQYGNPLALTYSLLCGIDSFLELTP